MIAAAKSRPVLMSAPMIRAILDGHKTVTRRVIVPQPSPFNDQGCPLRELVPSLLVNRGDLFDARYDGGNPHAIRCPYGAPGELLWLREKFAPRADVDPAEEPEKARHYCLYAADGRDPRDPGHWHDYGGRWRPSIHMPRALSRIILRIADVRAERLAAITEADAVAEGAVHAITARDGRAYDLDEAAWCRWSKRLDPGATAATARGAFAAIWERLNGKRPGCDWTSDPWVWRIAFDVVKPEEQPQ